MARKAVKRYRCEFSEVWFRAKSNIDKEFNSIISKKGQVYAEEGESYLFKQRAEVKFVGNKKSGKVFTITIEFNVKDLA